MTRASAVCRTIGGHLRKYSEVPSFSAHSSRNTRESTAFDGVADDAAYQARYRDPRSHDRQRVMQRRKQRRLTKTLVGQAAVNSRAAMQAAGLSDEAVPDAYSHSRAETPEIDPSLAALFPGVGSQFTGMCASLMKTSKAFRETWDEAEEALSDFDKWRQSLDLPNASSDLQSLDLNNWAPWIKERAPDQLRKIVYGGAPQALLTKSSNSQPAILITSIALLRTLESEYNYPLRQMSKYFCGHSSGEYSACVASGVMSFKDGVRLTRLQGLLTSRTMSTVQMEPPSSDTAPANRRSQMSAVLVHPGHSHEEVAAVVAEVRQKYGADSEGRVEVAAYNSTYQVVLTGSAAGVNRTCDLLLTREIGVHAANLPSWAPFHSKFMKTAESGMRLAFQRGIKMSSPAKGKHLVSCQTGDLVQTPQEIANCVIDQIAKPVQWSKALANLRNDYGARRFVYMGPGKALSNLAKREVERGCWANASIDTDYVIASISSEDDMRNLPAILME